MNKKMGLEKDSPAIAQEKLAHFKKLFPEAISEGKVDVEALRRSLGENVASNDERYNLDWAGKTEAFKALQTPTIATLAPCPEESVDFEKTGNVFIEGENLEVLKVLQKAYYGKIKMIYIDPPYNTGSDSFIYPDRFQESKEEYLKRIEEKDEEGYLLKEGLFRKNSKENGHYHSNWLSMMYPRLFLARNLLRDDGVIFISIDDNEVHNLRLLMNEVFGEENFIESFVWKSRLGKGSTSTQTATIHEYILCYAKDFTAAKFMSDQRKSEDEGKERLRQWGQGDKREDRPSMYYPVQSPYGEVFPIKPDGSDGRWRCGKTAFDKLLQEGLVQFEKQPDGRVEAYKTIPAGTVTETAQSSILDGNIKTTAHGTKEILELFGEKTFSYPKPTSLIAFFLKLVDDPQAIVMDFFAGSAPLGQAVLDLNKIDKGSRKFICVQLAEKTEEDTDAFKAGCKTIADIGKERIRRVSKKIKTEAATSDMDLGLKVFKLKNSNFKIWRGDVVDTAEDLERQMDLLKDPVKPEAREQNLLWELLLKSGYDLNTKIAEQKAGKCRFYSVAGGELAVILNKADEKCLQEIVKLKPRKVICLDNIFEANDQLKTNTALQMKDAGIEFRTI